MSRQYNARQKRMRRKRYLERLKRRPKPPTQASKGSLAR